MDIKDRYIIDPYLVEENGDFSGNHIWRPYFHRNAKISSKYINIGVDVNTILIKSDPIKSHNYRPVLFIPGWFSTIPSWIEMLNFLSKNTRVYYFESREKSSSQLLSRNINFSVEQMAEDLNTLFASLDDEISDCIIIGSSIGGTAVINYLARFNNIPNQTVLIGPNPLIKLPPVTGSILLRMPLFLFKISLKYIKWHVIKFRLNANDDAEQVLKYLQVLRLAIPWRMKKSANHVVKYNGWNDIAKIKSKVIYIGSRTDKMHSIGQTKEMYELTGDAEFIEFESNQAAHSVAMAEKIFTYCIK